MKTVVVQAYCDLCTDAGEEHIPATTERTFDGYLLDLCERHDTEVTELLVVLNGMFKQGVELMEPPPRPRKGAGGRPRKEVTQSLEWRTCQDCGHVTPTRSALGQHVKQRHSKLLRDYVWST